MSILEQKGWPNAFKPIEQRPLAERLLTRWPEQIFQVKVISDDEYLLVLQPDVDAEQFEKTFSTYLQDVLHEEWKIRFRVFNYDFSVDFEVEQSGMVSARR